MIRTMALGIPPHSLLYGVEPTLSRANMCSTVPGTGLQIVSEAGPREAPPLVGKM